MSKEHGRYSVSDLLSAAHTFRDLRTNLVFLVAAASFASVDAQSFSPTTDLSNCLGVPCEMLNNLQNTENRIANVIDLNLADSNKDGILNLDSNIMSGDMVYRTEDGVTQVESGLYIVPSNRVFVDVDADGVVRENETVLARIVVVTQDNLTYLFYENSSRVEAIFPNGTGKPGANTVASVRRINAILPAEWGQRESEREHLIPYPDGTIPNYFGDVTLGTRFYLNNDPLLDIDSRQEVHGTFRARAGSVDGVSLLGTEISGGCIRHSNEAIRYIATQVGTGDIVITMYSPEDDHTDSQLTLYNRTRLAAGLLPVQIETTLIDKLNANLMSRPINAEQIDLPQAEIATSFWLDFSKVGYPTTFVPVEHPFTRGQYNIIPCGTENLWITSKVTGRELMRLDGSLYSLVLPEFISGSESGTIRVSDFYVPRQITTEEVARVINRLSLGDPEVGVFEFLFSDLVYQYAEYLISQSGQNVDLLGGMDYAVALMNDGMLRQVQLVTGVLPVRYFTSTVFPDGLVGDRLGMMSNRTMIQHAMNVFYGESAPTYELDPREEASQNAFRIQDMEVWQPAMDNEVVRTGEAALSTSQIIIDAVENNDPVVFRISYYRYLADLSFFKNMPAGHYFSLIPEYSNLEAGYIGVYDTMHPFSILLVPLQEIPQLFTTVTIG